MSRRSATRSTARSFTSLLIPTLTATSTSNSRRLTVASRLFKVSTDASSTTASSALPTSWTQCTTRCTLLPRSTEPGIFRGPHGKTLCVVFVSASCRLLKSFLGRSGLVHGNEKDERTKGRWRVGCVLICGFERVAYHVDGFRNRFIWVCPPYRRSEKDLASWSWRSKSVSALGMSCLHRWLWSGSIPFSRTPADCLFTEGNVYNMEARLLAANCTQDSRGLHRVSASSQFIDRNFTHGLEYREIVVEWFVVSQSSLLSLTS